MRFLLALSVSFLLLACGGKKGDSPQEGDSPQASCLKEPSQKDFACDKMTYLQEPCAIKEENGKEFYQFSWQDKPAEICYHYDGFKDSELAKIKNNLESVITRTKNYLGLIVPLHIFSFDEGQSREFIDQSTVRKICTLRNLGRPVEGCIKTGDDPKLWSAAAGVSATELFNGGIMHLRKVHLEGTQERMKSLKKSLIHEFFHIHQNSHKFYNENTKEFVVPRHCDLQGTSCIHPDKHERVRNVLIGPNWIEEGGADFAGHYLARKFGFVTDNKLILEVLNEAREVIQDAKNNGDSVSLEDYDYRGGLFESKDNPNVPGYTRKFAYQYTGGMWAFIYLCTEFAKDSPEQKKCIDAALNTYYKDLAQYGYKESFKRNFKMSLEEFYPKFDAFMLLSKEQQEARLNKLNLEADPSF